MISIRTIRRTLAITTCVMMTATGCAFKGVNSLPLPGAVGRGSDANVYHVEVANVGTLEPNSPVMIDDVIVGSVGKMTVQGWHANVEVSIRPEVVVPANAVASVGQTSLLGSMHLQLNSPVGEPPHGRLAPGSTIPLDRSSTYPSTEQTLSSLSLVVNSGGLSQLGDVIHNSTLALSGSEQQARDLISRLDTFVGTIDEQRQNIISTIQALNRLASTFAGQRDTITDALNKIPRALEVLNKERPRITTAMEKLGTFSDTAARLINDSQADLVINLQNLEPTIRALADVGPDLPPALATLPTYPMPQNLIDRGARGDYMNLFIIEDITRERLKRTLLLGTRFGQPGYPLIAAPGEPSFLRDTFDPVNAPMNVGIMPSQPDAPPGTPPKAGTGASTPTVPPAAVRPETEQSPPAPPNQASPPVETPWPPSQMDVGDH